MYAYENLQFGYYILFELNKNNAVARQKVLRMMTVTTILGWPLCFYNIAVQYCRCACYAQRSQNLQCRTTALFS